MSDDKTGHNGRVGGLTWVGLRVKGKVKGQHGDGGMRKSRWGTREYNIFLQATQKERCRLCVQVIFIN